MPSAPSGPPPDGTGGPHVFVEDLTAPQLSKDDHHHLAKVRRVRPGSAITISDGAGSWAPAEFDSTPVITGPIVAVALPSPLITVAMAPVKSDRTATAVQKLTELGVDRILFVETARSVVRWKSDRRDSAVERLRAVARSAAEQSRQVRLPELSAAVPLVELVAMPGVAVAERGGMAPDLRFSTVVIGPEGGWTPDELGTGTATVGLGSSVLRAETAAIAAGVVLTALRAGVVRGHAE